MRSGEPQTDRMRGHDSARILELQEAGPTQGRRDLLAMVKGRVVVAIGRMKPSEPQGRAVADLIADLCALEVGRELTVLVDFEIEFEQSPRALAQFGRQVEIQRSDREALVIRIDSATCARADVRKSMHRQTR